MSAAATQQRWILGSDHAGRAMRLALAGYLLELGHQVHDHGPGADVAVDYPDCAREICRQVVAQPHAFGLLVCGTGIGMSMAANAVVGIRAALCCNAFMAKMARAHNDANVLCLGERVIGIGTACTLIDAFVATEFAGGRHRARLDKLAQRVERL